VTTGILIWRVVPKFVEVFKQVHMPVSGSTLAVVYYSEITSPYPWIMGFLAISACYGLGKLSGRAASIASVCLMIGFPILWGWMLLPLFAPLIGPCEGIGPKKI
jgi:type II secretory pathway component PulF